MTKGGTLGDDEISPARALFINPKIKHLEAFKSDLTQPIRAGRNPTTGKWELDKRGGDENAESRIASMQCAWPTRATATTGCAPDSNLGLLAGSCGSRKGGSK